MKLLIVGRNGQVARALRRQASERGLDAVFVGRPEADLETPNAIDKLIAGHRPGVVINAAAYTAVDGAESDRELAYRVNATGAGVVARAAALIGAPIVHVSTDYVFAGDKSEPYVESDPTGPTGVYGASKLEGERLVCVANERAVIVRSAWIYSATGVNFVRTMLRLTKTRSSINVVNDQRGCPTYAYYLAGALLDIAMRTTAIDAHYGIYHCVGGGEASWADFARTIFAGARERGGPSADVIHISTDNYPTAARRPANSRLNCDKLEADYGVRLRDWREALPACLDEIAAGHWSVE